MKQLYFLYWQILSGYLQTRQILLFGMNEEFGKNLLLSYRSVRRFFIGPRMRPGLAIGSNGFHNK